jgi:hypothetical protein
MQQLNLFENINSDKFPEYHKQNTQIYDAFKKTTFEAIEKGHRLFSAEFVFNVIRWNTRVSANDTEYKINNNYKAFYSRMFMNEYPQHKGLFLTRKSKFD